MIHPTNAIIIPPPRCPTQRRGGLKRPGSTWLDKSCGGVVVESDIPVITVNADGEIEATWVRIILIITITTMFECRC
ncbi:unnamed protein product [Dibothriocephalus latus]|uniref:Uncharacterized protein n=1 Tax=Dibothriocephalus latus TaxID=60516 RepID=A0A3P6U198_DIBLA|nr:unnamed protein product [Dibothriocephalus latus]